MDSSVPDGLPEASYAKYYSFGASGYVAISLKKRIRHTEHFDMKIGMLNKSWISAAIFGTKIFDPRNRTRYRNFKQGKASSRFQIGMCILLIYTGLVYEHLSSMFDSSASKPIPPAYSPPTAALVVPPICQNERIPNGCDVTLVSGSQPRALSCNSFPMTGTVHHSLIDA
jgi:hypothetical protein